MAKRVYDDQDRARVFAALSANDGNIKRSARETGTPVATVRDWKRRWEQGDIPPELTESLPAVIEDFVTDATRVRNKLLHRLEQMVDADKLDARAIVPALGMLQDKIRAYTAVEKRHVEHTIELPSPEKMKELFSGVFEELIGSAKERSIEIDDAVWEDEPSKELVPATPTTEVTPSE